MWEFKPSLNLRFCLPPSYLITPIALHLNICQILKPIGMNIVTKGTLVYTIVIMKATYLNNVVYGYIKVECSLIQSKYGYL